MAPILRNMERTNEDWWIQQRTAAAIKFSLV